MTISKKDSIYSKKCEANNINLLSPNITFPLKVNAKIRYNSNESPAIIKRKKGDLIIDFDKPQLAITPGQSIVFYQKEEVIGGAIIK